MEHAILQIISEYGYISLFLALMLGIIGLPIPDETLLTFAGYLVSQGTLHYFLALPVAFLGSFTGMTISYYIGFYIGSPFIEKYGKRIFITPEKLKKVEKWFERFGKWTVTFGYFIPGIRHFTAYSSGISKWPYATFVLYAMTGDIFWTFTFITLGYLLGEHWQMLFIMFHQYLGLSILMIIAVIFLLWTSYQWLVKGPAKKRNFD